MLSFNNNGKIKMSNKINVNSIDELAISSDQDLFEMNDQICYDLVHCNNSSKRQLLEVELCYLQRELQLRSNRQTLHSNYLSSLRDTTYEDESQYPLMDEYVNYSYVLLSRQLIRSN